MFHYFNSVQNKTGDALTGYFVKAVDPVSGNVVNIFADVSATPIVTVSGIANAAQVDSNGNVSFYVSSGTYHLDLYAADSVTFLLRVPNIPMVDTAALSSSSGAGLVSFLQSGTGAVSRTVQSKLTDIVSFKDFGAVGDGVTTDTTAITAVNALSGPKYAPSGTYLTTLAATSLNGPFYGFGQVKDSAGYTRGPWFTAVTAAPAASGNFADISTSFNGDLSKVLQAVEHRVSGSATLGNPTTGYLYTPEAAAKIVVSLNTSGWNQSTSTNDGRTSATVNFAKLQNNGQGDHAYLTINGVVNGAKASATDFLANPAICMVNGTFTATANAVYLNPFEVDLELGTYDAAAVGYVTNVTRNTGDTVPGLNSVVGGFRCQSNGTYAADWALSATGLHKSVVDATTVTLTTAKAGACFAVSQRIYGNASSSDGRKATSYGNDWIERSNSGFWSVVYNNVSALQVSDTKINCLVPIQSPSYTVATLPTAGTAGRRAFVTDATATTFASVVAGSGTNKVPVYDDGAAWRIG